MKEESTETTPKNKCVPNCLDLGKYYGNDYFCRSSCSVYANNKTINESDSGCISQCDLKSKYKFLQVKESGENKPLFCREKCYPTDDISNPLPIRYSTSNYICVTKCEAPNNYVVEDENSQYVNQCRNKCPDNTYYIRENENGEYICSTQKCEEDGEDGYKNYYMDTNICLKKCGKLYSYHYNSKDYCVDSCDFFKDKILYHDEGEESVTGGGTTYNYRCVEICDNEDRPYAKLNGFCSNEECTNSFYFENDKICLLECPKNSTTEEGGKICTKCTGFSPKKYIDENGNCVDDCAASTTGYIYHNKINPDDTNEVNNDDNYVCLKSCPNKIEGNLCVDSCTGDNPFNYDNICAEVCPFTKRFFLPEETEKKCLNDCPSTKKYYIIEETGEDDSKKTFYKCQENCQAYIPNINDNFIATFCFKEDKCMNDYKFYELDEDNNKKCLSQCPKEKSYYKDGITEDVECYDKCPDNLIHLADSPLCQDISKCTSKIIRYKDKECIIACSKNEKAFTTDDGITYCVDNCTQSALPNSITNFDSDLFLTYENKCVKNCPDGSTNNNNNECICNNLYYIDKATLFKHCLTDNKCTTNYPINVVGTKECTDYCDGILSTSEIDCYPNNYTCDLNTEQKIQLINGKYKCDCIDKYYYELNEYEIKYKKCLPKNENCPSTHSYLIIDTKECVENCPEETYNIKFGETCISKCPPLTEKNEETSTCECKYKYYIGEDNIKVCLEENKNCPEGYPLMTDDDPKRCIKRCPNTKTLDYNNKKCIDSSSCDSSTESKSTEGDAIAEQYAESKCRCKNKWYYDPATLEEICDSEGAKDCSTLTNSKYNYFIGATNQCVKSCSGDYKFIFGNQCFKDCEEASSITNKNLVNDGENKCKCSAFSKYDDLTQCFETEDDCITEGYSVIKDETNNVRQCYEKNGGKNCPKEYPVYLNLYCYKDDNCPDNFHYNIFTQSCDCNNLWHEENSKIICLESSVQTCPKPNYPLLITTTNQCIESTNEEKNNYYELNNKLYLTCPNNTVPIEKDGLKKCGCNNKNKWYSRETSDGNTVLKCDQEECPQTKPYIDLETNSNECLDTCGGKYIYRKFCRAECPELTEHEDGNKECILKLNNEELNLNDLEEVMANNLLDLYKSNEGGENATSSQKIITKNATVEFYGVNIKNKENKGNSEQNIQSDLSYIDISGCIEKLYRSNEISSDVDIIILKFDKNESPKNYLIYPVEYKFINSKTGHQLDASVCQHNSIKISYPLHNLINKYDNLMRKHRILEYVQIDLTSNNKDTLREKLDKGKEINSKYSYTDIFNINDNIYSDICFAVEVDGKDLVLKDRINYFYPHMSLCENNCTYNHTDFVNERIYCDCSYKTEFDFNRDYFPAFEINYEKIKNDQGGNSNIGVIKCISNLKNTKSLSGNYGFVFILIILILELILLLVIIFYEFKSLLNKLKDKMKKDDKDEKDDKIEVKVININSSDKKEKDSQRSLNAPPKRKEEFDMEFIPQEYLFLFFNQNEKGVIKKVEREGVPFKTKMNTRILLERIKGVNYDNFKARGPFPDNQNILVIVDNVNDSLSDYINDYNGDNEYKNKNTDENDDKIKNSEENILNKEYESLSKKLRKKNKKYSEKDKEYSEKFEQKPKLYKKYKIDYTISDYDPSDENYSEIYLDGDKDDNLKHEKGFIKSIKKEQRLLKKNYEISSKNKESSNFFIMLFTEIIDKIYITKILLFTRKFDILSFQLSAYFLCHTLLLILLALFYDIETIEKIWNKDDYPDLGYYLLYGFISCIVIWIVYKIILCLWSNNDKIKDLLRLIHGAKKYGVEKCREMETKYKNLAYKIKFKLVVYTIIEFLLLSFCFVYFVTFCTVFTGTRIKVFISYGIALIEVLIIKIIYGIVLAIMRKISLDQEKKTLYNVVLFMDTYLV